MPMQDYDADYTEAALGETLGNYNSNPELAAIMPAPQKKLRKMQ